MVQTFPANESSLVPISEFLSTAIQEYQISEKLCSEYSLLFEELTTRIISAADSKAVLTIEIKRKFENISVSIKCPGKSVLLESESSTDFSGQIIKEFSEHLRQSYSFGVNEVVFTTSYSSNETLLRNLISCLSALCIGLLFRFFCSSERLVWISENVTLPVVLIFIRCMQTVAVPVAFFSLAAFVVNIRRTFDRNNKTIRLSFHYVLSSAVAIGIGVLAWSLLHNFSPEYDFSAYLTHDDNFMGSTLSDFLTQLVSSNILEPFFLSNPIPFLVNALLTGFAASSVFGKSGDTIRGFLDAINDLFARMMNIIYGTIPFFLFFAVLDLMIQTDIGMLRILGFELLSVLVAMLLLIVYYILRLVVGKVNLASFFRNYTELLLDNLKIASNIDSFPYNKRILARKMSLSRDYLSEGLKLGILLNMDGNCLAVSIVLLNLISIVGVEMTAMKFLVMGIIMLLFSAGAPNAPGSFLLGMIILMSFVGISSELLGLVLIIEAFISKFYSFLNAAGDIFTLVIEDEINKRKKAAS